MENNYEFVYDRNLYRIPLNDLLQYKVTNNETDIEILSQRDSRWKNIKLGFGKTTIGTHGCFITCLAMMTGKRPDEVNEILKKENAFYINLVKSEEASKALGLEYKGKDKNKNNMPQYSPCIKEVRMGKSQHFVVRMIDKKEKLASKYGTYIIDPWTGTKQKINHYPFKSYRLFKKTS